MNEFYLSPDALILVAIAVATLLWADLTNRYVWVALLVTLLFGAIGWVDDYRKLVLKNSDGLPARNKIFWQSVIGLGVAIFLYMTAMTPAETALIVPFFKDIAISLGWFYVVLTYFVIVGSPQFGGCRPHSRKETLMFLRAISLTGGVCPHSKP